MLRCHAIARLVNPHNHKCVAAYGWLRNNQQIRYWVSIESDPHLFFSNIDDAREFYRMASGRLRAREAARRPRNYRRRHEQTLAALAGGKEKYAV